MDHQIYSLGEYQLDAGARRLSRDGQDIHLSRLPFQVFVYLVENRDRVVARAELLDTFWEGKDVYDDALRKAVGAIRKALDDSSEHPRFVETKIGEGYRYVGPFAAATSVDVETPVKIDAPLPLATPRRLSRPALATAVALVVIAATLLLAARSRSEDWAVVRPSAPFRSVAVLPLENLTGDAGEDYLVDGLTESLIGSLSRINNLKVISRRSAFALKGARVEPSEVGRRLGVDAFVEGSVRKSGDELRVEVRLVRAEDGKVLWASDAYDRSIENVLGLEDEIACGVASELRVTLCGDGERVAKRYTENAAAYRAYLKGRYYWNLRNGDNLKRAAAAYEEAVRIDRDYALAYAGLAETYAVMEANQIVAPREAAPKAEAYALKAMSLDDSLPGPYAALGMVRYFCDWRWEEGEDLLREALERNPRYVPALHWHANLLLARGQFADAEAELRRAQDLDPLSIPIANSLAETYGYWRRSDRFLEQARAVMSLIPDEPSGHSLLAKAYLSAGRFDEAAEEARLAGGDERPLQITILMSEGRRDDARRIVDELAHEESAVRAPFVVAGLYAGVGDTEASIAWLDRAYRTRQADLASIKIDPALDSIRSDPRYAALVRRVGLDG